MSQHTVENLISVNFSTTNDKAKFKDEVVAVKRRLREFDRRTINPNSRNMRIWDIIVIAALLITALITPFEVAFFQALVYAGAANFTMNRIIDAIFVVDIVVTFFLPYRTSVSKGGMLIFDNRRIACNYLTGWFSLDLITCIPFDLIFAGIAEVSGTTISSSIFRMLRVLRVLKLARILRASRILNRWRDHIALSSATTSLSMFSFLTCLLAHWLACLWGFMAVRNEELWTGYGSGLSWIQKARVPDSASIFDVYLISLYVALNTIFGGSCEIQAGNYVEFAIQATMLLIGCSVWAYVIGSACGIIATLDPAKAEFRQTLDQLNYFCKEHVAQAELSVRMRSYFRNTLHVIRSRRYESLLYKMSVRLRGDAAYRMCEFRLSTVPFLVDTNLEPEFMCQIAIKYRTSVYSKLERVPCTDLFVVERGVVAKRGRLGLAGACFGKDVILANENLRDVGDAIALTFVQAISLSQQDIFELLPDYPLAFRIVRKAALQMALNRALVHAAQIIKGEESRGGTLIEMFDRAMREAKDKVERAREEASLAKSTAIPLTRSLTFATLTAAAKNRAEGATGGLLNSTGRAMVKGKGKWGTIGMQINQGSMPNLLAATKVASAPKIEELLPAKVKTSTELAQRSVQELSTAMAQAQANFHGSQAEAAKRIDRLESLMVECVTECRAHVEARADRLHRRRRAQRSDAEPRECEPATAAAPPRNAAAPTTVVSNESSSAGVSAAEPLDSATFTPQRSESPKSDLLA